MSAVDREVATSCAREAEQLLQPLEIHQAPAPGSPLLQTLGRGRFIYRCGARGEWLGVMFPGPGEAVDCSTRRRADACSIGWVKGKPKTDIFG